MYLEKHRAWNQRVIGYGIPAKPQTGDRGPVINAMHEIISAAGGVEYSLKVLKQNSHATQEEYIKLCEKLGNSPDTTHVSVPEVTFVYYDFSNLVVWTRTVYERCKCLLLPALNHEKDLKKRVEAMNEKLRYVKEFADYILHFFTPPYSNAGTKVENGCLVYPIPDQIKSKTNLYQNLTFEKGHNVHDLANEHFEEVNQFVSGLLDEFYPLKDEKINEFG